MHVLKHRLAELCIRRSSLWGNGVKALIPVAQRRLLVDAETQVQPAPPIAQSSDKVRLFSSRRDCFAAELDPRISAVLVSRRDILRGCCYARLILASAGERFFGTKIRCNSSESRVHVCCHLRTRTGGARGRVVTHNKKRLYSLVQYHTCMTG